MRSVVERSDTFQRLPITLRAPAKWKARVSPRMPSPPISRPSAVSHAESVTRSADIRNRS